MNLISYESAHVAVRADFARAHNRYWNRLAGPGNWLTGSQRVAVAEQVRQARSCTFCEARKSALSPTHVEGVHDGKRELPNVVVDAIHRIVTDPGRLTRSWFDQVMAQGVSEEEFVEIVGTVVSVLSIDDFCRGIGVPLNSLPEPRTGDPDRYRPRTAVSDEAWVSMIPLNDNSGAEADLWQGRPGNVLRAMSLVPEEVRTLKDLTDTHYIPLETFFQVRGKPKGTLTRVQMEIVASRVSALNGCFY